MLRKLSDILKEHKFIYGIGTALTVVSRIAAPFVPHLSFLLLFMTACGVCTLIYGILLHLMRSERRTVSITARVCRHIAHALIVLFIISFIFIQVTIVSAFDSTDKECDYILVLGCGLRGDELTLTGKYRADAAISYMQKFPDSTAVLCGGKGERESISEAQALYNYMAAHGIDSARLLKEERSTDTTENIRFAVSVIEQSGGDITRDSFCVVTNDFHLYRSMLIMKKAGFNTYYPVNGGLPDVPLLRESLHIREYFSIIFEYLNI